jgi:predicted nucleic acid-binding protein
VILVDTSVWVDHFRRSNSKLVEALEQGHVLCHPFIIGELACGHLKRRTEVLRLLDALPQAALAEHDEVLHVVERNKLPGKGLGWIDAHLLTAAMLSRCELWTRDRSLASAARKLKLPG